MEQALLELYLRIVGQVDDNDGVVICSDSHCLAIAALCCLALVNLLPVNPFFDFTLSGWRQGRYVHFNSIARWLAWIWPYAALIWLGQRVEHAWLPAALRR